MRVWFILFGFLLSGSCSSSSSSSSSPCCPAEYLLQKHRRFEQKADRFWEYEEKSNTWVEVALPLDLFSCVDGNCTRVGTIISPSPSPSSPPPSSSSSNSRGRAEHDGDKMREAVPARKRLVSLRKMSETSIWVTGQSGSIYERFWNGVRWVIAPHDLQQHPSSASASASSVFMVNHTILALSHSGSLFQMELSENSQPVWVDFSPTVDFSTTGGAGAGAGSVIPLKYGFSSNDNERIYFCTKNGSLLELVGEPPRWLNHGRPPGADVAAIADAGAVRPEVIFTISSTGDLYEYDVSSKPSWKKHIRRESEAMERVTTSLKPAPGSVVVHGHNSVSLFLLTKSGDLVERRLSQRKWKWVVHGVPEDEHFASITPFQQDDAIDKSTFSLFLTSAAGTVWEYRAPRCTGSARDYHQIPGSWVNHMNPPQAKVATSPSASGLHFQVGRIFFPLDDGRLAELHHPGLGGETTGPAHLATIRRKASPRPKYIWSVLDAPESEGWNAEYCSEERGPLNCVMGVEDETSSSDDHRHEEDTVARTTTLRGRKGNAAQQSYLIPSPLAGTPLDERGGVPDELINMNFRLRVMHGGRSFFLVMGSGPTFEYLNTGEDIWLWLRHDHETSVMRGAVGDYNGSLFFVDENGSLLLRERDVNELVWVNCTAMKKGRQIIGGSPWNNRVLGKESSRVVAEDSLFFLSKTGRLMEFTVAFRKFKWKDCKYPSTTKIASIVDQEMFRENIVFVIGRNGRLYQYNRVTEIWHEHRQSQHLVLSRFSSGTAMRRSLQSSTGSLFMLGEDGGLIEYHWDALGGEWNWVEHGTPHRTVSLVVSTGPGFEGSQLFLIGSDGNVYLRHLDQTTWRWKNCGFPGLYMHSHEFMGENRDVCLHEEDSTHNKLETIQEAYDKNCDSKVAPIRPIPFTGDSVIFELRDGRLAEMLRREDGAWGWSRTIGTPASSCISHFWTGLAS